MLGVAYRFGPSEGGPPRDSPPKGPVGQASTGEDLAYRVEIWDRDAEGVEQVLAVTSSASIGYAAFYAATREFPERHIVLRFRDRTMNTWTGQRH